MEELKYDKWMDIILEIDNLIVLGNNPSMTKITYMLEITYSHVYEIFHILEDKLLINTKRNGRTYTITLTPKGKLIAQYIRQIKKILEEKNGARTF